MPTQAKRRARSKEPGAQDPLTDRDLDDGVTWIRPENDAPAGIGTYVREIATRADRVGLHVEPRGGREIEVFGRRFGGYVSRIAWAIAAPSPGPGDLVHSPNVLSIHRATDVLTVHDLEAIRHPEEYGIGSRVWSWVLSRVNELDAIVVPSHHVRRRVEASDRLDPARVEVIPHGIDHAVFRPVEDPEIGPGLAGLPRPWVLLVGAYRSRKRFDRVIRHAGEGGPSGTFVRVGPPGRLRSEKRRLEGLAHEKGWAFRDEGYVSRERLRDLYAACDVLAMPSRNEGFGFPPLEAAAVGTPSITSDVPVFDETLGDRRALFERHATLQGGIEAALAIKPQRLRRRARRFTWARSLAMHADLWADLLDDGGR